MCIFVFWINKWFCFCCTFGRCFETGYLFISLLFNKTKYICSVVVPHSALISLPPKESVLERKCKLREYEVLHLSVYMCSSSDGNRVLSNVLQDKSNKWYVAFQSFKTQHWIATLLSSDCGPWHLKYFWNTHIPARFSPHPHFWGTFSLSSRSSFTVAQLNSAYGSWGCNKVHLT